MLDVRQTLSLQRWLSRLRDRTAKARLVRRIERLAFGHFGDHRSLGAGLFELREHFGPGYRVYYTFRADRLVLLLAGGDKSSQASDIARARIMINNLDAGS